MPNLSQQEEGALEELKLKIASPEEAKEIGDWLMANSKNDYDPDILKYPTFRIITSYGSMGNVAHLPSQQALILESVAVHPIAGDAYRAQALRDLVKAQELIASMFGLKEIYFLGSDERVVKLAEERGFRKLDCPVLRLKL